MGLGMADGGGKGVIRRERSGRGETKQCEA